MDSSQLPPSSNHSSLRFPIPVASQRVSSWIDNQPAGTMARSEAPSDDNTLDESAYEFVDTDDESRDDNATESVVSTDYGRDDIASLADTERSREDGESGDEDSPDSSGESAHQHSVDHAFNTPTISRSSEVLLEDFERPLIQSIEFEEPCSPLGVETTSVKHTVAEFNEEETAGAAQKMNLPSPPKRMAVTIRQTMTKQGLSTRDPLRILFVGNHSARQDIIHKIASSVTASVENGKRGSYFRSSSQLYNVVPVSAFGSERTPEIELMHSSGYQIKVEDCILAQNLKFEDIPEKPDVIKLTLEDNFSYHSVPDGEGYIIEPSWELPHVAIVYCSENDDIEAKRTMTTARKFMSRHGVPSIVISHKELFERGQCMSLDQHSMHMCLESRDPNGRGTIIHRRLPIDLASFLNIDARQMNRNLAFLTGLYQSLELTTPLSSSKKGGHSLFNLHDNDKHSFSISDSVSFIRNQTGAEWRAYLPVGIMLLSILTAVLTGIPSYRSSSSPAISINSNVMSAVPMSTSTTILPAPIAKITTTSTSTATSTKTVTVKVTHSPGPNSLAVVPAMELGKLSNSASSKLVNRTSICSAEILGDREILIRIPSATKLTWLTKEAMSVNITRNNVTVDTERAYSSDDGIVLLLAKNQAFGLLNISIITTKKPRVNETFQVDFGTIVSQSWQTLQDKFSSFFAEESNLINAQTYEHMRKTMEKMLEDARLQAQTTFVQMQGARRAVLEQTSSTSAHLAEIAKSISAEATKRGATLSKDISNHLTEAEAMLSKTAQSLQGFREPLRTGLFKAQIQSKLLWLKLQGKDDEYAAYERRASKATRVAKAKKGQKDCGKSSKMNERLQAKRVTRAEKKAAKNIHA